ncbi:MAG: dTDP-4-dehydrorhamnose 3,5-epimerase [Fusobacteriaceae bacterium]
MEKFKIRETGIKDLLIIEPKVLGDNRGFFFESYSEREFENLGISEKFLQENHSLSHRGVLRGLHFQREHSQGKLVRVIRGGILDVAVDLRKDSPTFGKYYALELTETNRKMFYIPPGFAHGFLTLQENTEILYKCTDYYYPEFDSGIIWNDSDLSIDWKLQEYGINSPVLSAKDMVQQTLGEFVSKNIEIKWGE